MFNNISVVKKHIPLFVLSLLVGISSNTCFCQVASDIETRILAEELTRKTFFQPDKLKSARSVRIDRVDTIVYEGITIGLVYYYAPEGFAVVPKFKQISPYFAFSSEGDYDNIENIIDIFLKQELILRYKALIENKIPREKIDRNIYQWKKSTLKAEEADEPYQVPAAGSTTTGGLIETSWGQESHYDDFCPNDPITNLPCKTGCSATAMAQIVNYWGNITGNPDNIQFYSIDNYTSVYDPNDGRGTRTIPIDATAISLSNINYPLSEENQGWFSYACGVSLRMKYSSSISVAHFSEYAFKNRFGFTSADYLPYHTNFTTTLYENIENGMPCMLAIYDNPTPPNRQRGHAIICDGFIDDGTTVEYHLNYGYYGQYAQTGLYYEIPANLPAGYTTIGYGIVNIFNSDGGILSVTTDPIVANQHNSLTVNVRAPANDSYYVGIWNETGLWTPIWEWDIDYTPSSLNIGSPGVYLNEGQGHNFSFGFTPNTESQTCQVWLYREFISGVYILIDRKDIEMDVSTDNTPPNIDQVNYSSEINTDIHITFSEPINESTLITNNIIVQGSTSGIHNCTYNYNPTDNELTIDPQVDFEYNETVTVLLTEGITDLAGNELDGDNNGTPGPSYSLIFTTQEQIYTHDYAITSMTNSNQNPNVGDIIIISGVVKNVGESTEPADQRVYLYDNDIQQPDYDFIPVALTPGQEYNIAVPWTSKEGPHNLALRVQLTGDENSSNDEQSISVFPGTEATLYIDGSPSTTVNITLSPGNSINSSLQLGNIGTAPVDAIVSKGGEISNWITLTSGSTANIPSASNLQYNYSINVPSSINNYRTYSGNITYSYDNGKTATAQINVQLTTYDPGYFRSTLSSSSVHIDGTFEWQDIVLHQEDYLDNYPSTSYPSSSSIDYNLAPDAFNRINYANWYISVREIEGSANLRIMVPEGSGHEEYSRTSSRNVDILGWLVNGYNTFRLSLDDYTHDAANVIWEIGLGNSSIKLRYSLAGWGASCPISDAESIKDGIDYCRLYFQVDNIENPGDLILCNSGVGQIVSTRNISSSDLGDEEYFSIGSNEFFETNYFSIKGDPDDETKVDISNIRLEIKYYQGDPNLLCTKTLSKTDATINEDITVSLRFNNIGDNIADEPRYNDSPLPSGIILISGSLSGDPGDLRPGDIVTESYNIYCSTSRSII